MLMFTVATPGEADKFCDITIADILGPLKVAADIERERDANFSLLSYSFSLVGPGRQHNLKHIAQLGGSGQCKCVWGAGAHIRGTQTSVIGSWGGAGCIQARGTCIVAPHTLSLVARRTQHCATS